MDESALKQVEVNAVSRERSQMKWGLGAFEFLFVFMLLSTTFLVPDVLGSRERMIIGLAGLAGLCAFGSGWMSGSEVRGSRRLRTMMTSPQVIVFALIMIPVLLVLFSIAAR